MTTIQNIENSLPFASAKKFDVQTYSETGYFILRQIIPQPVMRRWQEAWQKFHTDQLSQGRNVNAANPVALTEELPEVLATMYREPALIETAKQVFGENIALYNHRFVIKDAYSPGKVFLHQDSCYHLGKLNKCSLFVPLTVCNEENGGLRLHAGSHKLGYLGDAGEINPASFEITWPTVTPELCPGDVLVMNSSLWHESGPNRNGIDRILADIILQPADDPTGKELLSGEWKTDVFYSPLNCARYFLNSRVLKIIKYERELGIRREP